jgi:hypothetical protein
MTKLYKKYAAKIRNSEMGETDIIALRSALGSYRRTSLIYAEKITLFGLISQYTPRICDEQARKGIAWLRDQWKTPKGIERKRNPFSYRETVVLDNFSHFTLVDLQDAATCTAISRGLHSYLPVYRVHDTAGRSFDYVAGCWQGQPTGERLQIIG